MDSIDIRILLQRTTNTDSPQVDMTSNVFRLRVVAWNTSSLSATRLITIIHERAEKLVEAKKTIQLWQNVLSVH